MLRFCRPSLGLCLAVLLLPLAAVPASGQENDKTPAMKIREVLEQQITLELSAKELKEMAKRLSDKTGIPFAVDDRAAVWAATYELAALEFKAEKVKLSSALRRFLAPHKLMYVVLEDSVVICQPQSAAELQLGQIVSVRCDGVPLRQALANLGKSTPFNLVFSLRDEGRKVSLDVENVTLEAAVGMLAELASAKAVVIDNVVYVTVEAEAEKLRSEAKAAGKKLGSGNGDLPPPTVQTFGPPVPYGPPPAGFPFPPLGPPPSIAPYGPSPALPPPGPPPLIPPPGPSAPEPQPQPDPLAPGPQAEASGSPTPTYLIRWKFGSGIEFAYWASKGTRAADPLPQAPAR